MSARPGLLHRVRIRFSWVTQVWVSLSLFGAKALSIDVGIGRLSLYRITWFVVPLLLGRVLVDAFRRAHAGARQGHVVFMTAWVCAAILSGLWTADRAGWANALVFIVPGYVSSVLVFAFLNEARTFRTMLRLVVLVALASCGLGFYEIATGNYLFAGEEMAVRLADRSQLQSLLGWRAPVGFYGNPNNFALLLLFATAFSAMLFGTSSRRWSKAVYAAVGLLFITIVAATQSRSGAAAIFIMGGAYAALTFVVRGAVHRIKMAIAGVALLGALAVAVGPEMLAAARDVYAVDLAAKSGSDAVRVDLIRGGWRLFRESPLLGVGVGSIDYHLGGDGFLYAGSITRLHNWWLELLVSSGLVLFAWHVWVLLRTAQRAMQNARRRPRGGAAVVNLLVISVLLAFVVGAVGPSSLLLTEWFWPLLALVLKAPAIQFENGVRAVLPRAEGARLPCTS